MGSAGCKAIDICNGGCRCKFKRNSKASPLSWSRSLPTRLWKTGLLDGGKAPLQWDESQRWCRVVAIVGVTSEGKEREKQEKEREKGQHSAACAVGVDIWKVLFCEPTLGYSSRGLGRFAQGLIEIRKSILGAAEEALDKRRNLWTGPRTMA